MRKRPFERHAFVTDTVVAKPKLIMELQSIEQTFTNSFTVAAGVWGKKDAFVNYYIIKDETSGAYALVDAGLMWSASSIRKMAKEIIGENGRPSAIILTHGHFDHTGSLKALVEEWNVPVYAHTLEHPYLTGKSSYPPPDPSVGGGAMASLSFLYPTKPIDISEYVEKLPEDNTVPGFPEWKYIHTPGHTPGHISLYREKDKVLIAGDAFVTTKAESAICALSGMSHLSGPPKYFTPNWAQAKVSVMKLAALDPEVVASGHGKPMLGEEMRLELNNLSRHFDKLAVPDHGRYVNEPALADENGLISIPPAVENIPMVVKTVGIALGLFAIGFIAYQQIKRTREWESPFPLSKTFELQ
jgi:glyoxylase-like metal-dependent hydrolase (beta-lactamase superfamily II)